MTGRVIPMPGGGYQHVPPREDRDWVTSSELVNEAGITYRQLDYWARTGLLTAHPGTRTAEKRWGDLPLAPENPGSGHTRGFPVDQVGRARAIRDLLAAGISLQIIRQVLDQLVADGQVQVGHITFTYRPEGAA